VNQLALFGSDRILLDGALGTVTYRADVISAADAARWFEVLRDDVPWQARRRVMYEREVDVPRLVAQFRFDPSGQLDAPVPAALGEVLRDATRCVREIIGAPFNSVGVNRYRDGNDSVAPHHDKLHDLVAGQPIALLSLGAVRRMAIRPIVKSAAQRAIAIDLAPGSLLVMSHSSQLHTLHGIAKTREAVGTRISLALRVRPDA
jgi:alkylated DNA repair dioxygenase AlkB